MWNPVATVKNVMNALHRNQPDTFWPVVLKKILDLEWWGRGELWALKWVTLQHFSKPLYGQRWLGTVLQEGSITRMLQHVSKPPLCTLGNLGWLFTTNQSDLKGRKELHPEKEHWLWWSSDFFLGPQRAASGLQLVWTHLHSHSSSASPLPVWVVVSQCLKSK